GCVVIGRWDCGQLIHYNNCVFGGINYKPDVLDKIKNFVNYADYWHYDYCRNNENGWSINAKDCSDISTVRCSSYKDGCTSDSCNTYMDGGFACPCENARGG
ncbi:7174_t:CDS:1, partial [Funneliformis mosseae]